MKHKVRHIHFVGIGGAGMSGIAEVLAHQDYVVSGSDTQVSTTTEKLTQFGVRIDHGHQAAHVDNADVVVKSSAIADDNPEVLAAEQYGIPVVERAEMLGELMRFKQGIAVAGTHGKTTTTSLIASLLAEGGLDPTFVIGGKLLSAASHAVLGQGDYLVAEADESDASFLRLTPVIAVITNIDFDHMDTYGQDENRLIDAFDEFLARLPFYGVAVLCTDDPKVAKLAQHAHRQVIRYGFNPDADIRAVDVSSDQWRMRFDCVRNNDSTLTIHLNAAGEHNVLNALAAIAVATELGVANPAIQNGLAKFMGVGRRFERQACQFTRNNMPLRFDLIDDYGHHPTELDASINALRQAYPERRLVLIFQPHRYSRTRDCYDQFVRVLARVDFLILTEIYPAGEAPIAKATGRHLIQSIRQLKSAEEVLLVEQLRDIPKLLFTIIQTDDIVLNSGAGSIASVPPLITQYFSGSGDHVKDA